MDKPKETPVIVCGGSQGRAVIYGYVSNVPEPEKSVTIKRAKMILRWAEIGLLGVAAEGPRGDSRLTYAVPEVRDTCRQCIVCSPKAAEALDAWPTWEG